MTTIPTLILVQGAVQVAVPLGAAHDCPQTYEPIEAATLHRLASGAALKQSRWTKWSATITGRGKTPAAFGRLDFAEPMALWCVAPMVIDSPVAVIALPAARRPDRAPSASAVVGERILPTTLALVDDLATLTAVVGADHYRVSYFPVLTVYASRPRQHGDGMAAEYGWDLTAEEV